MDGTPQSTEAAESERADLVAWVEDFNQRQQELANRTHRIAFLNGWLMRGEHGDAEPALGSYIVKD